MPDRTRPDNRPDPVQSRPDTDRTTIAEAATRLGISTDAVRKRLARGQLAGEKVGGSWVVFTPRESNDAPSLPPRARSGAGGASFDAADRTASTPGPDIDRTETGPDRTVSGSPQQQIVAVDALIAAKDETIDLLRQQLEARTDELRAAHVIISQLTQRMPAIAAGEHARSQDIGSVENVAPGDTGEVTERSKENEGQHRESVVTSMWRRLFGRNCITPQNDPSEK